MADYQTNGLLSGLANGLQQGMITYQTMKNIQHSQRMQELASGVQKNADTGELEYTPEKMAQVQQQRDMYSPDSDYSKGLAAKRGLLLHSGNPNIPANVFNGLSGAQQKELEGYGKADLTGYYGMLGNQAKAAAMGGRVEVMRDDQASKAGHAFEEPLMNQMTNTKNNLDRAMQMLNGKTPITAKNFAILQQDMINAMAPGGAATEGKVSREMVHTLQDSLNDLALKFGNVKDLRQAQPQVIQQLRDTINGVRSDYATAAKQRVKEIGSNFSDVGNPKVQRTVQRKMGLLNDKFSADQADEGGANEVERQTADGKIAIFDAKTKQFLRYK